MSIENNHLKIRIKRISRSETKIKNTNVAVSTLMANANVKIVAIVKLGM